MEENNVDLISQLNYLAQTKQQIKSAIIEKGQEVSDLDTFRSYVSKIENINTLNPQVINVTPQIYAQSILPDENHNAISEVIVEAVTSDIDPNIINGNIKNGVTILGVSGKSTVVDTEDSNATAEDIMDNSTAYVNGQKLTGTFNIKSEISAQNNLISNQENTINQLTNLISNIYASDVNVVTADANITNLDVMEGKIGYSNNGQRIVGTRKDEFVIPKFTRVSVSALNYSNGVEISVSNWNTSNVTNMSRLFMSCKTVNNAIIDVSNWDTSNVTNMSYMFYQCNNVAIIPVSNWDTSKVTDMSNMFYRCYYLTTLDVSNWDTSNVTNMSYMFYETGISYNNNKLDVSNWDTSKVTDMSNMFAECRINIDNVEQLIVNGYVQTRGMFCMCYGLGHINSLNIMQWNLQANCSGMFSYCSLLDTIYLPKLSSNISTMFNCCTNLRNVYFETENMSYINSMAMSFGGCNNLSDSSIHSIINICLNSNVMNHSSVKTLNTSSTFSPFYRSTITNDRYQNRWEELTAAGWTY